MIAITAATGQLGRLVIESLLERVPAAGIAALVRSPEKAADLAAKGLVVRHADYNLPQTLDSALEGVDKLLLISSSEIGRRVPQHAAVIAAAKNAGVKLLAYTSILHGERSPLVLREEHVLTEQKLVESQLPHVLLRNGWYTDNYTANIAGVLERGSLSGCEGDGRISSAARTDYAEAAAKVLTAADAQAGRIYELAGDSAFTMSELAAEITRQAGKAVVYQHLTEADYKAGLIAAGLPEPFAAMLAANSVGISQGGLFDDSHQLRALIGRPTTPLSTTVAAALKKEQTP
jgi:NAD(P)H dehydrogenase (quinone)